VNTALGQIWQLFSPPLPPAQSGACLEQVQGNFTLTMLPYPPWPPFPLGRGELEILVSFLAVTEGSAAEKLTKILDSPPSLCGGGAGGGGKLIIYLFEKC
jgi:hypothetical protein